MNTIIWHNPSCSTSRNALALLNMTGNSPDVVAYLKTPPTVAELTNILTQMNMSPRELLRTKEPEYMALGLENDTLSDKMLIEAMVANPILINRPIVITDKGTVLPRPFERIFSVLDDSITTFTKENGEVINRP